MLFALNPIAVRCLEAIFVKNFQRFWWLRNDGFTLGMGQDGLTITVGWLYDFFCAVLFFYSAYVFGVEAFVALMVEHSCMSEGEDSREKAIRPDCNEDGSLRNPSTVFSMRRHITQARGDGGFNRRGIFWTIYYCYMAGALHLTLNFAMGRSKLSQAAIHILVTVLLSVPRMLSTQAMIAQSTSPIAHRDWKALYFKLFIPALVLAISEVASIQAIESIFSYTRDWKASYCESIFCAIGRQVIIWSVLVVSGSIMAFGWLLPLSMALARVEATLLPRGSLTVICIPRFTQHTIDRVGLLQPIRLYVEILRTVDWTDVKRLAGSWIKIAVPLSVLLGYALLDR